MMYHISTPYLLKLHQALCSAPRREQFKSQYECSAEELVRREARNRSLAIEQALALVGELEVILDDLHLYWRGDLRELKEALEEMK